MNDEEKRERKKDSKSKSESPNTSLSQIITDFECKFLISENIHQAFIIEHFTYKIISENFGYSRVNPSRHLFLYMELNDTANNHFIEQEIWSTPCPS